MKGELYQRWLADDRGVTLGEYVAECRAGVRQFRAQQRFARQMGPLMQELSESSRLQLQMNQNPAAVYGGNLSHGLGSFLGGAFR